MQSCFCTCWTPPDTPRNLKKYVSHHSILDYAILDYSMHHLTTFTISPLLPCFPQSFLDPYLDFCSFPTYSCKSSYHFQVSIPWHVTFRPFWNWPGTLRWFHNHVFYPSRLIHAGLIYPSSHNAMDCTYTYPWVASFFICLCIGKYGIRTSTFRTCGLD